ncbi:MAG: succinate dehydrogenase [Candidatus Marsarchaeota archaeon]|nr:succinate dehydrogenase [Candidatus Marsarchaeota archaeon]
MDMNINKYVPGEFLEYNPRLYAFMALIAIAMLAFFVFPVKEFMGYIDPFYSPTILILPLVGLYRLTCYAYRKDYNRHIFRHPAACPVADRMDSKARPYTGETSAIFKAENLHRYFLYAAIIILPFFFYDVYVSLTYSGAFVLRLGSVILLINAVLLTLYVFSCHSLRSLIGGRNDCFSCMKAGALRKKVYDKQSWINAHHEELAWISLLFIIFVDLFLRGLAAGMPIDFTLMVMP